MQYSCGNRQLIRGPKANHHISNRKWTPLRLNLFSVAITEFHRLNDWWRMEVYLAHSSGSWQTQECDTASAQHLVKVFCYIIHDEGHHMASQIKCTSPGLSSSCRAMDAISARPTLMTSSNLNHLLKALSPNSLSHGLRHCVSSIWTSNFSMMHLIPSFLCLCWLLFVFASSRAAAAPSPCLTGNLKSGHCCSVGEGDHFMHYKWIEIATF